MDMGTIVYLKDGDSYLGEHGDHRIDYWIKFGQDKNQNWMYKGFNYYSYTKRQVVVYSEMGWSKEEMDRRRHNGFQGIKEYYIKKE